MEREFRACIAQAAARGQTVFLSSHQLAEVEAVCDRVAILRSGRLIQVASISELRGLHRSEVTLTYTGTPPALAAIVGVDDVQSAGDGRLRFTLIGSPAAALKALAEAEVTGLAVREPSLEEIFLDYYGTGSTR
jgi:ABC-2 type transport system ATP-binding protein